MNSKEKGDITETQILARLVRLGYKVLIPWGDNSRYDLVIDEEGKFSRIQCKTGRLRNGCVLYNTSSVNREGIKTGYENQAEFFGVYCKEIDKCYLVPVKGSPKGYASIRINKTKSNQKKKIKWAKDYEI